jgi:hypothetical protein
MFSAYKPSQTRTRLLQRLAVIVCVFLLAPGDFTLFASQAQETSTTKEPNSAKENEKLSADQLDSLVAPIALYPDPLLSQTLVASTYPLEVIQLQQWLTKNKDLKEKELTEAVKKQEWDPSIQAMAALPDVVKQLADNIKWTTDLGNAFLAQQSDVMDAVQRMRKKAKEAGNLKSTEQQKVESKKVETKEATTKEVIVIQQANPEVIYVPTYSPVVVYGPPVYPYPPIVYPSAGYYAAGMAISFGVGMAMGAAWNGGWGWGAGWGHNDIDINVENNFNRDYNRNTNRSVNRQNASNRRGGNTWQHNPQHRGGAPYSNRATANRYGGTARGDTMATRQASARQTQARQQAGSSGRSFGGTQQAASLGDRSSAASLNSSRGGGERSGGSFSGGGRSSGTSAFGSGGFSGSSARASSQRGASSFGGGRGGGRRR